MVQGDTHSEAEGGIVAIRARSWRRLRKAGAHPGSAGYGISLYKAPWRTFIAVHNLGRTCYVPLMRDQRVESLEPLELLELLELLEPPTRRAQVPFRVAGTDRVVWPGGGLLHVGLADRADDAHRRPRVRADAPAALPALGDLDTGGLLAKSRR